jgi:hypothetical protein
MRTAMMTLAVVGLLAAPSLGVINVKLVADGPIVDGKVQLAYGATTTIRIMALGTSSGILSLAGDVVASAADPILLTSNPGSGGFPPAFNPPMPFAPKVGSPGPNGGWINWGTQRTDWIAPDPTLGMTEYVEIFHYTITATAPGPGDVHLSVILHMVSPYKALEIDKTGVIGMLKGTTIHVPEPMTMGLLALGGLIAVRRRLV